MGAYTEDAIKVALGAGLAVLAFQGLRQLQQRLQAESTLPGSKADSEEAAHAKE